jgi:signal peptidase I
MKKIFSNFLNISFHSATYLSVIVHLNNTFSIGNIEGRSMQPTFNKNMENELILQLEYIKKPFKRGDIITFM